MAVDIEQLATCAAPVDPEQLEELLCVVQADILGTPITPRTFSRSDGCGCWFCAHDHDLASILDYAYAKLRRCATAAAQHVSRARRYAMCDAPDEPILQEIERAIAHIKRCSP